MPSLKTLRNRIASVKATQKITKAMQMVEVVELRGIKQIGFGDADSIGQKVLGLFAAGAFDVCTMFFAEFRSVISQIPTTRQLIPAQITAPTEPQAGSGNAIYEYE